MPQHPDPPTFYSQTDERQILQLRLDIELLYQSSDSSLLSPSDLAELSSLYRRATFLHYQILKLLFSNETTDGLGETTQAADGMFSYGEGSEAKDRRILGRVRENLRQAFRTSGREARKTTRDRASD